MTAGLKLVIDLISNSVFIANIIWLISLFLKTKVIYHDKK